MVTMVQFMVRADGYDHEAFDSEVGQEVQADAAEFVDMEATERMIVEETAHVDE